VLALEDPPPPPPFAVGSVKLPLPVESPGFDFESLLLDVCSELFVPFRLGPWPDSSFLSFLSLLSLLLPFEIFSFFTFSFFSFGLNSVITTVKSSTVTL